MKTATLDQNFEDDAFNHVVRITEAEAERRISALETIARSRLRNNVCRISAARKGLSFKSYLSDSEREEIFKLKVGLHLLSTVQNCS